LEKKETNKLSNEIINIKKNDPSQNKKSIIEDLKDGVDVSLITGNNYLDVFKEQYFDSMI